jgi:hypothetical protein
MCNEYGMVAYCSCHVPWWLVLCKVPGEVGRRDHGFLQTIKVEVDYIFSKTRRSMHCLLPFSCRSIDHNHIINPAFFQFSSHNAPNLMSYYSGEDPDAASTDPAPNVLSNDIRLDEQSR